MTAYTIYCFDAGDGTQYFTSLADAKRTAKNAKSVLDIEIERCRTVDINIHNLIDILASHGGSWVSKSETVCMVKAQE